jgi:hypothetical protein
MLKQLLAIVLCGLLFETMLASDAWALQPAGPLLNRKVVRVKKAVDRVGTGTNALVAVRLCDKSVVSGWVSGVGPDSFQVTDPHSGAQTTVRFLEVSRLAGTNLVSGHTVHYGGGIHAKLAKAVSFIVPGRHPTANGFAETTLLIIGIVIGVLIAIVVAKAV